MQSGILIIDKPADFTSFDVVAVVRKCLHEKKTGHTGTLDPMATGVLPILLGSATKAQALLPDSSKEYEAEFRLGITTDTLDITGTVLDTCPCRIHRQQLEDILPHFRGDIMQVPPMYSAVSKDGVRLYELARKGIVTERQARPVTVDRLELICYDEEHQCGKLKIACSKGTYIRVICDDIGKALGCGCVMTSLRRTRACGFTLEDAITIEQLRQLGVQGGIEKYLRPIDSVFAEYGKVKISENQTVRFQNGGGLLLPRLRGLGSKENGTLYRICSDKDVFLGLGVVNAEKDELSVKKRF